MRRFLALLLVLVLCLGCTACKRTDSLSPDEAAQADPTPEPPREAVYAEGFVTPEPTAEPTQTPTAPPVIVDTSSSGTAYTGEDAAIDPRLDGDDPEEPADPDEPPLTGETEEPDPFYYDSITNATLKVKFAYPQGWTSSPSTDVITMVEPVAEGDVPARVSVTSFQYTEAKATSKKLKAHMANFLKTALDGYNEYKMESTSSVTFVGSAGMSATYLAIQGNNYIRGIVYAGYTKATKKKKGRVYILHFSCEEADFEGFLPLAEKLAASVTEVE